jgi:hypothetical protein
MSFFRSSANHITKFKSTEIPPLAFADNPCPLKLKSLDHSTNKTRVDIGSGLPATQVSLSSISTQGDFDGDYAADHYTPDHYTLPSYNIQKS